MFYNESGDTNLNMEMPYEIRWAKPDEWSEVMDMVWATFMKFDASDYTDEGIASFKEFITDEDIHKAFIKGTYQIMVALDNEKIIGMGSVRDRNRLSLLFVDGDYHYKNIGRSIMRKLCGYLRNECGEYSISVKASPYAVEFYKKIGFRITSPEKTYSGIRVTSMVKIL